MCGMGIRMTGITTPFVGASWEYTEEDKRNVPSIITPERKIRVFISSICGVEKYDKVRAELKSLIESTQLANVYMFEEEGASTLEAGNHYIFALEDSDVCIFLIDNKDGITSGVQKEIDTVKKCNIKALYYFCDETKKEKTALEQSLMGAKFAKSKPVHSFDELSRDGAQDLINDIIDVYHYYCIGKMVARKEDEEIQVQGVDVAGTENLQIPTIKKSVLKNIDKCKERMLSISMSSSYRRFPDEEENSCTIDEWGERFLCVLFEGKSVKEFNVGMFLSELKKEQSEEYHSIVAIRWQAIQAYYLDDLESAIFYLNEALKLAKEKNQPSWIIKDILIDLRNLNYTLNIVKNCYVESEAQKELTQSTEELYYPILDRIHDSLQGKYIEGLYKSKITSPYTVSMGNNFDSHGELLASSYIVSIYNGSLTQILLLYDKIRDFVFYLSNKYDDWNFRRDLLKFAVHEMNEKHIKGIQDSYPEVLNKLDSKDAAMIMDFSKNHPIKYKRLISQFYAFGAIGYYLDDETYKLCEKDIVKNIKEWIDDDKSCVAIGSSVLYAMMGAAHRISQDTLSEICCLFFEKHYSRWYMDLFKFIARRIDINKMSEESAKKLITHIINIINDDEERKTISHSPLFLCTLRKQNRDLTSELDKSIAEKMTDYYEGDYKLETTEDEQADFAEFTKKYLDYVKSSNASQGKNGVYSVSGIRSAAVIRAMLSEDGFCCDDNTIDEIVPAISETILESKESISTKLDAVSLLICIAVKYPDSYKRNKEIFEKVAKSIDKVENSERSIFSSNIDIVALKLGIAFFASSIGLDSYLEILQLMPLIQNDNATTISVTKTIIECLEIDESFVFPKNIELIVLQNVLQWLHSDYLDIRWNATRILISLLRNPENVSVINHQIITLVDSENVYIKNLIMRNIHKNKEVLESTKDYVFSKCETDPNFVVRMVCEELKNGADTN